MLSHQYHVLIFYYVIEHQNPHGFPIVHGGSQLFSIFSALESELL